MLAIGRALMAFPIAHRGYVIQTREIIISDSAEKLKNDPTVQKAYLGIE